MFRKCIYLLALLLNLSLFSSYCSNHENLEKKADLVIYSYDRPLQLYALLESMNRYMTGLGEVYVIYRSTQESYACAYEEVKKEFQGVNFMQQGDRPYEDFQPLTLKAVFGSPHEYVIFGVDDIIIKDYINLTTDIQLLENTKVYGFYYRLGKNLSYCYTMQRDQSQPPLQMVTNNVYAWQFCQGECDWGYPNTVDMTLYRKAEIKDFFEKIPYEAPNPLEGKWGWYAPQVINRFGLCYENSKIVNLPLNRVQNFFNNVHMGGDPKLLLQVFNEGKKIDITQFFRIANKSAHQEFDLVFMPR